MRKSLFIACTVVLFLLTGCSKFGDISVGHSVFGGDDKTTSIFVGIELESKKFSNDDNVEITFSHGHDIPNYYTPEEYGGHLIEIYIYDSNTKETHEIYSRQFDDDEYFAEENRCITDWKQGSKIEYSQNLTFDINFSDYGIDEGKIYIRITETNYSPVSENGIDSNDTIYNIEMNFLSFTMTDEEIEFYD